VQATPLIYEMINILNRSEIYPNKFRVSQIITLWKQNSFTVVCKSYFVFTNAIPQCLKGFLVNKLVYVVKITLGSDKIMHV